MKYSELVKVYEELSSTTKRLEKTEILSKFLKKLKKSSGDDKWIYLLRGRVLPESDSREFGISRQLTIKAISSSFGVNADIVSKNFNKIGDLGEVAEEFACGKKQSTLFSSKLTVKKVYDNLLKLIDIEGKGTVGKKVALISELMGQASGKEAKYIARTLLNDLRVGAADGVLRDSIAEAFFEKDKKEMAEKIEDVNDLVNDFAIVFEAAAKGKKAIEKIDIIPGTPIKVMLPVKVTEIKDAFRICGKPAAIEHKYDGFRMIMSKNGKEVKLFTRRLENVTNQFPDVVKALKENVTGESFILDGEVVGYDPKTKKSQPFEAISQRIRRKYHIEELVKKLPVEINVFDIVYHNRKSLITTPFNKRREKLEKVIKAKKMVIRPSVQIVTGDEKKVMEFYQHALDIGEEGVMFKKIDAPYKQGRRVGYIVKMKPEVKDLDLVIVGAEHGTGKRAGWFTSYIVACKDGDEFLEVGKVASGLKEIEGNEGITYAEMTKLLKPLIISEKGNRVTVKPKIVVSLTYQNVQKSPSYNSGYALRFPRITHYRPDRKTYDITTLKEVKKEVGHNYSVGMG